MIITIPDDDSNFYASIETVSKAEAPTSVSSDSSMCQSNADNPKKDGSNPYPTKATAARGHSTYGRSTSVDRAPSDQAASNTEPRSRTEACRVASHENINSAQIDGMSLRSNFVAQQGLIVGLKA